MGCAGDHSAPPRQRVPKLRGSPGQKGHSLWEGFQMRKKLPALDQLDISKHFPVLIGPKEALEGFQAGPGQGGTRQYPNPVSCIYLAPFAQESPPLARLGPLTHPYPTSTQNPFLLGCPRISIAQWVQGGDSSNLGSPAGPQGLRG